MVRAKSLMFLGVLFCVGGCCEPIVMAPVETTPQPLAAVTNPLLLPFETTFGVPPFDEIRDEHYMPAFEVAFAEHLTQVDGIVGNEDPATFQNTIEALDYSGALLEKVAGVFFPKKGADTNDAIQEIAKEVAPRLSAHEDSILMNAALFARVKTVYDNRGQLDLDEESARLLTETYKEFVRGGALLGEADKAALTEINSRISVLEVQFGDNVLAENNEFKMYIEDAGDLAGLPESAISGAAEAAAADGHEGQWLFTLHKPSLIPFLQFSEKRSLREKMFKGYIERGNNGDARDNKEILVEMVKLRIQRAHLMGYETHAHFVLEDCMAKEPAKVYELLDQLWAASVPMAKAEAKALQQMIDADKGGFQLEAWDWWYYTERLRKEKYDLSEDVLRAYFDVEKVQQGAFDVATKLWGLQFVWRDDMPVYHPDVKVVEVQEEDGTHVGILYLDYFPRESKRGGAWMTRYRGQEIRDGEFVTPVVANVFNFSKPTAGKPALISLEEVSTLFHEFGHALHGLLSHVKYPGLSGTAVARDFVELPSQFMENWAVEPAIMKEYARHYETGEPIPGELIAKIKKARHFNEGFATSEYLAASYLDMNWHTIKADPGEVDVVGFERDYLQKIGLVPQIASRYRSTYFAHIFAGGYSSGYYSYIWAAVLDADAFAAFGEKENLFDKETASSYRDNILSRGNTGDPMALYLKFRGAPPSIQPLLERRGLTGEGATE